MECSSILECLEQLAPVAYACEWDNVGLLAGTRNKDVKTIYIALEADDAAVEGAVRVGADLLITHHPLLFKPLKRVNDEDFISRRILKLIQNNISYYAMHTNFDVAPNCMADLAAGHLELTECSVLEPVVVREGVTYGIGKVGMLKKEMSLKELGELVKKVFQIPFLTIYGLKEVRGMVSRIAVCPGSGGSLIKSALNAGAEVLITGDIGHHEGIDAAAEHMAIIDAGHYGLEYMFVDFIETYLTWELGADIKIYKAPIVFPAIVM